MDAITIEGLEIFANHGVYEEEKKLGQKFIISVKLYTDLSKAGKSDDLNTSINYAEVSQLIYDHTVSKNYDLIEALAQNLAYLILNTYTEVKRVWIRVDKPNAPINHTFETVSVEIERMRHTAFIALGSNIGNKEKYIHDAVKALNESENCKVVKVSDLITTSPYGGIEQDDFLNGALILETLLSPFELLDRLHEIEAAAGRERAIHWGPRTLDLDIIFYDDCVIDTSDIHIPHIDLQNRLFVLEPMMQLAPYFRHPVLGKTVEQLWNKLKWEDKYETG